MSLKTDKQKADVIWKETYEDNSHGYLTINLLSIKIPIAVTRVPHPLPGARSSLLSSPASLDE